MRCYLNFMELSFLLLSSLFFIILSYNYCAILHLEIIQEMILSTLKLMLKLETRTPMYTETETGPNSVSNIRCEHLSQMVAVVIER